MEVYSYRIKFIIVVVLSLTKLVVFIFGLVDLVEFYNSSLVLRI